VAAKRGPVSSSTFRRSSALAANQLDDGPFDDVRADDLYLAIACAARVKQAIIAFDKHYLAGLASALIRQGQDRAAGAQPAITGAVDCAR
jgi:hypothetical protein